MTIEAILKISSVAAPIIIEYIKKAQKTGQIVDLKLKVDGIEMTTDEMLKRNEEWRRQNL